MDGLLGRILEHVLHLRPGSGLPRTGLDVSGSLSVGDAGAKRLAAILGADAAGGGQVAGDRGTQIPGRISWLLRKLRHRLGVPLSGGDTRRG